MIRFCILFLLLGVCACSRQDEQAKPSAQEKELSNKLSDFIDRKADKPIRPKVELTPEQKQVREMQRLLDDDKVGLALREARSLMDSKNGEIRSAVLETLQWIGRRALPEITEMLNDPDEQVATEALTAWELAFGEFDGDRRKALAIEESVVLVKKSDTIRELLRQFSDIEQKVALQTLSKLIEKHNGTALGECARECYEEISDGKPYEPPQKP